MMEVVGEATPKVLEDEAKLEAEFEVVGGAALWLLPVFLKKNPEEGSSKCTSRHVWPEKDEVESESKKIWKNIRLSVEGLNT